MNSKAAKFLRASLRAHLVDASERGYAGMQHKHKKRYRMCCVGAIQWFWIEFDAHPVTVHLHPQTGRARYRTAKKLLRDGAAAHAGRLWQREAQKRSQAQRDHNAALAKAAADALAEGAAKLAEVQT